MIRVNIVGRACGGLLVLVLALAAGVWRLHSLASELDHDLRMRQIARSMDISDEVRTRPGRDIDDSRLSAPEPTVSPTVAAAQPAPRGQRWAELEALHREWGFWVVNLEKRPDRLACAMQEFNRLGMQVSRLHGIDGTLLDLDQLSFVTPELPHAATDKKKGMLGHKGCLYSHIEFLLRAVESSQAIHPLRVCLMGRF